MNNDSCSKRLWGVSAQCLLSVAVICLFSACRQKDRGQAETDIFFLEGHADTTYYEQAPFEWHVTLRHDYSETYVTKFSMCHADYDPEYLGKYRMRDNGKQILFLNCEEALKAIKGMDALTLGMPKIVYLVGWQYNGHDSKYPAFFAGNDAIKRPQDEDALESIRWLMTEAKKYHTTVSLHINMFDAYPDSPLFDKYVREDVLAKDKDGKLLIGDWGYKISYAAEWEKGLTQQRLDSLCHILPLTDAGTIHIDAFHNAIPYPLANDNVYTMEHLSPISPWHGHTAIQDMEARTNIVRYLDKKGIDVTTEGTSMAINGYIPMYWHYNSMDFALSLNPHQATGANSALHVFGNQFNCEGNFIHDKPFQESFEIFKKGFCEETLIWQYLNRFDRIALITDSLNNRMALFTEGVRSMWKDERMYVSKDGHLLAEGGNVFIPALWKGNNAIIAFSEEGYANKTWTLPNGISLSRKAKAWTISVDGQVEFKKYRIHNHQITLSLAPYEMILIEE